MSDGNRVPFILVTLSLAEACLSETFCTLTTYAMNQYKITSLTPRVGNDDDDSEHEVVADWNNDGDLPHDFTADDCENLVAVLACS